MIQGHPRRDVLVGIASLVAGACSPAVGPHRRGPTDVSLDDERPLNAIEASVGGRVGVFAIDTGRGLSLGHRADERFAMCSTFKWVLAAAVLARVDRGDLPLDGLVPYGPADLEENASTTRAHVAEGSMTVEALAEAAVTRSDNTAANLLLARVGGPAGLTAFARRVGDVVTRLDRNEPSLNENAPGDARDTTTPRAMAALLGAVLCRDILSPAARDRLSGWMRACETGRERLRAGLPAGWIVGDKTGTGGRGAVNDVAIAIPPGRAPILIAAYLSDGVSPTPKAAAAHAEIARIVARRFG